MLARRDGEAADGGHDGRVAEFRLGAYDAVGDVVVDRLIGQRVPEKVAGRNGQRMVIELPSRRTSSRNLMGEEGEAGTVRDKNEASFPNRMLLLLDLQHCPVLERPSDDIRVRRGPLDLLALGQGRPEGGEVLKFDQVPDGAQRSFDHG